MCGIAGIFASQPQADIIVRLKSMTDAIAHRGPDGEGHWVNTNETIALGHRRLSIIDLSETANQPMHFQSKYTIVFNGEIYNYLELREQLVKDGYSFQTSSDTEVLLALFDQKKERCLNDLDGMFAFAIWDKETEELFCARDRFGEKPFFYTQSECLFHFASEMKAFWACGIPKKINRQRILNYLAFDRIDDLSHGNSTFFENVFQLLPAHWMKLKNGSIIKTAKYWSIDYTKRDNSISFEEAQNQFYKLLKQSVERRMRSDVPIGSSLSGGLDSSSIVMLIDKLKGTTQRQETFSARFEGFVRDEGKYIHQVVDATSAHVNEVFCTPELFQDQLKTIAYHQEEPFGTTSIAAQWNVMKLAKEKQVTVLLDGQGADEYLAGYVSFYTNYFLSLAKNEPAKFKKELLTYQEFYGKPFPTGRFFKLINLGNLRNKLRVYRNQLKQPTYLKQFDRSFLASCKLNEYKSSVDSDLNQALWNATFNSGLQTLLRYSDRNAMAQSREVRLPFLSHELVEFVFTLPDEFKIHDIWSKAILRFSMQNVLPQEICWRKEKVGFEPPNNKAVTNEEYQKAVNLLVENNIIRKEYALKEKSWEYVQVSMLFS